jgi:NADH:ubiquinone oxidoreductase subunit 3 (subunit A)
MLILFVLVFLTFTILLILNYLSSFISNNSFSEVSREEARRYECGFEQNSVSRVPLSIRYFMLTLVFLIFDMEIMLLLFTPFELFLSLNTSYITFLSLIFILLLFLGLLYE